MAVRCPKSCAITAFAILCGCTGDSPERAYLRVWSLYTNGALAQAAEAAGKETQRFKRPADAAWFWRFRLLEAEALLTQGKVPQASAAIRNPIPAGPESSRLELRRLIDQADALSKSGHTADAIKLVDELRPPTTDPDLQIRMDVLEGGQIGRLGQMDGAEQLLKRALGAAERQNDPYKQASALLNLSYAKNTRYR